MRVVSSKEVVDVNISLPVLRIGLYIWQSPSSIEIVVDELPKTGKILRRSCNLRFDGRDHEVFVGFS